MKVGRNVRSVIAAATSLSVLTASLAAFDMSASAADNQLNIHVYLCSTSCVNLSSLCDDVTLGTYGTPATFSERLPAITGYVYGYYANSGAYINFYDFVSSDIRHSPARLCANNYSGNESAFLGVIVNGCPCTDRNCVSGSSTLHHNNLEMFKNDLPVYNPDNECAMYITVSNLCSNNGGEHHGVFGASNKDEMYMITSDYDYRNSHDDNNAYAYARKNVVHEIGHLYNVTDHYNTTALPSQDPDCIWGANKNNYLILKNCTTCYVCQQTIYRNRNIYQHT